MVHLDYSRRLERAALAGVKKRSGTRVRGRQQAFVEHHAVGIMFLPRAMASNADPARSYRCTRSNTRSTQRCSATPIRRPRADDCRIGRAHLIAMAHIDLDAHIMACVASRTYPYGHRQPAVLGNRFSISNRSSASALRASPETIWFAFIIGSLALIYYRLCRAVNSIEIKASGRALGNALEVTSRMGSSAFAKQHQMAR